MTCKACIECGSVKALSEFYKDKSGKDGHRNNCKACHKAGRAAYRKANPEKVKAGLTKWYAENREYQAEQMRAWRQANPGRRRELNRDWYTANREYVYAQLCAWRKANPGKLRAQSSRRRGAQLNATPAWANHAAINAAYEACDFLNMVTGEWHHVDHIVPLRNKRVCGLHVPHNLQILPAEENLRKSNKFEVA